MHDSESLSLIFFYNYFKTEGIVSRSFQQNNLSQQIFDCGYELKNMQINIQQNNYLDW